MKKTYILLLVIFLISKHVCAQKLEDCSNCSLKKISQSDIKGNELYEIALLRNEIFARHNFKFNNERLNEYFSKFDWYNSNPNISSEKIRLNSIEKSNITVFKTKEKIIKQERKRIIQELEKLKHTINQNNVSLKDLMDVGDNISPEILGVIKKVLNSVDLQNINWHKGIAKYEIKIDNGYVISVASIHIKKNEITILSVDPMEHSKLMKDDAFDYPSKYYSEIEQSTRVEIIYINGKFVLKNIVFAG